MRRPRGCACAAGKNVRSSAATGRRRAVAIDDQAVIEPVFLPEVSALCLIVAPANRALQPVLVVFDRFRYRAIGLQEGRRVEASAGGAHAYYHVDPLGVVGEILVDRPWKPDRKDMLQVLQSAF